MAFRGKPILIGFLGLFLLSVSIFWAKENIDPVLWEKALKMHQEAIVIDTHADTPMAVMEMGLDLGKLQKDTDVDFIRMKKGGLDAIFLAVYVSHSQDKNRPSVKALELIDEIHNQVEKNPSLAELAFRAEDIRRIEGQGKRAVLIGMENGSPVEGSLRLLRDYYRLGVRYITLTHNQNNDISDSSTGEKPRWHGLSPFGEQLVKEMNRLGMLIDVSHISDEAFFDVLHLSRAPVLATHSCARTLCGASRNMSDDMIKALAAKGGVIHINFFSEFLDEDYRKKSEALLKKFEPQRQVLREKYKDKPNEFWPAFMALWRAEAPPAPGIEVLLEHIDHVKRLVGAGHIGLGSDFDGASSYPQGLEDVSGFPLITYHLLKRGYTEEEIKKILGGNFIRLFEEVEAASQKLREKR